MKKVLLLFLFFILASSRKLHSQDFPNIRFTHLTTKDGLSTNQVSCAFRDSHGIMWFGTLKGLNRYDGVSFKIFLSRFGDSTTIPNNHIVTIAEDGQGMLWLNSDGIICRFNPMTEKVITTYKKFPFYLFFFDSDKRLWIFNDKSLGEFDYRRNQNRKQSLP